MPFGFISHFHTTKPPRDFTRVWRKGQVAISSHQPELGCNFGHTELDKGKEESSSCSFHPLPASKAWVQKWGLFSWLKCNDNWGQTVSFTNSQRGEVTTKVNAFGCTQQGLHLMTLFFFSFFSGIQKSPKDAHLQTSRIVNHYHIPGRYKGIQQQRGW